MLQLSLTSNSKLKQISKVDIAVRGNHLTATEIHMPCGITQCYLPLTSGNFNFPIFTAAEPGTLFSDPGGMQG